MNFHPHAEMFPLIEGDPFDALVEDVREHGLREPITLFEGKILDGRNRYFAMLAIDPEFCRESAPKMFVEFDGDDALEWVVSKNLHRRQLTASQRAIVAAKIVAASPKKNQYGTGMPVRTAAKMLGVAPRTVHRAKDIIRDDPAAAAAIERGERRIGQNPEYCTISVVLNAAERDLCIAAATAESMNIANWMRKILLGYLGLEQEIQFSPTVAERADRNREIRERYSAGQTLTALSKNYGLGLASLHAIVNEPPKPAKQESLL